MGVMVDIAEAAVTELNAFEFSQPFTAHRAYAPVKNLEDLVELTVTVVPKTTAIEVASRTLDQHDYGVDVGVQKRAADDAAVDAMIALVGEIADRLRHRRLSTYGDPAWVRITNDPIYDPDHLERYRVFTSILTVTYRLTR